MLLQELLRNWPYPGVLQAWLDERARSRLTMPSSAQVRWVRPSIASRWQAERTLRIAARAGDPVLCFHGLPPLFKLPGQVFVFLQNYYYLGGVPLQHCTWRVKVRSRLEQSLSLMARSHVDAYLVQTPTMQDKVLAWAGTVPVRVDIVPLVPRLPDPAPHEGAPDWDFVYAADGQMHKNHRRLVRAWQVLAQRGFKPSLALPLSSTDGLLRQWIDDEARRHDLRIQTMDPVPHAEMLQLLQSSRALIFPSTGESFGLPLHEAHHLKVPILASERDFVRDVCEPVETFDPESAVSIARAVARFLGWTWPGLAVHEARAFFDHLDRGLS